MIAAVCWVPRGAAHPSPQAAEPPSLEEIQALLQSHQDSVHAGSPHGSDDDNEVEVRGQDVNIESSTQNDAVATALAAARAMGSNRPAQDQERMDEIEDGLTELDMDNYDNEDEGIELFGNGGLGAAYYPSNDMDPYLIDKDSEDEDEIEDMTIKSSDLIILTARNEDDVSHLEMWVYEEETDNMYVHHDVMLPAFPLCLAWLDCNLKGGDKGNLVAVGTMQPEIEIWDLDLLDAVEPAAVLGGPIQCSALETASVKNGKKKKKKKVAQLKEGSHSDAVLSLSWNEEYRNVLASASADRSVKIWDVVAQKCEHTIHSHSDKVQAVAWNPCVPTVLLTGSFDHTVAMVDMRAPEHKGIIWQVSADVESVAWDPHVAHSFVVSLEDGTVCGYDIRNISPSNPSSGRGVGGKALFTIHAHDRAVCLVSYNLALPNLLATVSTDKTVKLWDIADNHPKCLCSRNPKVGAVFAAGFCKDSPFLLALGGSKGNLDVWDTLTELEVARRFGKS